MKILGTAALLAGAVLLSACGGSSSHATCKDEASTKAYFEKFTQDMIANASKIDPAKAGDLQADMAKVTDGVKEGDYGALCVNLDKVKEKYGI